MSFPSAVTQHAAGANPEAALLFAMKHDTPLGFAAVKAVVDAARVHAKDPVEFVKARLREVGGDDAASAVLRSAKRGEGIWVNFDPHHKVAGQIFRLLGTDAARPIMESELRMKVGFANCCGVLASVNQGDVIVDPHSQVHAQETIDC